MASKSPNDPKYVLLGIAKQQNQPRKRSFKTTSIKMKVDQKTRRKQVEGRLR